MRFNINQETVHVNSLHIISIIRRGVENPSASIMTLEDEPEVIEQIWVQYKRSIKVRF